MGRVFVQRLAVAAALFLHGCAVGPDFESPLLAPWADYLPAPVPDKTASAPVAQGRSQRFVPASDIPPDWWRLFHSRALNSVIQSAIAANPSLEAAEANLRVAIANVRAQQGALFPVIGADFNPSRNKTPTGSLSPTTASGASIFTLFTAQATINYTLDVFGGVRRSIEAADAQADFQFYQLRAAYLTLAANVANAAVQEASFREQIEATVELIRLQKEALRLLRTQNDKGQIAGLDVVAQETALAQSELALPPLQKQFTQTRHLLSVLMGNFPNASPRETFRLADLRLPRDLPVTCPSELVQQRPDVQAAEANLHSASAQIGVAIANRLPNFTLTGNYGASSVNWDTLLLGGNRFWTYAGNAAQVVFDGDTLRQRQKAAEATFDAAAAGYRSTVLMAFQNVADALRALQLDALALAAASRAEHSASDYLNITQQKLQLGQVNVLSLIAAQQAYQQANIALIQARAARLTDTIALFQALGGGWWKRDPNSKLAAWQFHVPLTANQPERTR
jgi:NodT family efflux transporter outer membrane factor (OMF) lipoprotein